MNASPVAAEVIEGWEGRQLLGISIGARLFGDDQSSLYRAWETSSNRPLRLRIQPSEPEAASAAERLASVQHTHLYPVHRSFEHGGELFVAGPELPGSSFERFASSHGGCGEAVARTLLSGAAQGWWAASVHGCRARIGRASLFVEQSGRLRFDPFGLGAGGRLVSFAPQPEAAQLQTLARLVAGLLLDRPRIAASEPLHELLVAGSLKLDPALLGLLVGLSERAPHLNAQSLVEALKPRSSRAPTTVRPSNAARTSRLTGFLAVLLLAGVAAALVVRARWPETSTRRQAPPPSSTPPASTPLEPLTQAARPAIQGAPVEPARTAAVPLAAENGGRILELLVLAGARVEAGAPLAILTSASNEQPRDAELSVLEMRLQAIVPEMEGAEAEQTRRSQAHNEAGRWATLAAELRALQLEQLAELELHLLEVESGAPLQGYSSVDALRQAYRQADSEAERLRSTATRATEERDTARRQLEAAQRNLAALRMELEFLDLSVAERRAAAASERVAQHSYLLAPARGTVIEILVREGDALQPGDAVLLWQASP